MKKRTASCCCGQLTATCEGAPMRVSLCHCKACQKRTGTPYGIAAFYPHDRVEIAGQASDYSRPSDSGHQVTFHFCPSCGSTVYWQPSRMPDRMAVAIGAFADPDFPGPEQEVYTEHRHAWVPPLS